MLERVSPPPKHGSFVPSPEVVLGVVIGAIPEVCVSLLTFSFCIEIFDSKGYVVSKRKADQTSVTKN